METRKGRLIDHIHLSVADLWASRQYYKGCLAALRPELSQDDENLFIVDELFTAPAGESPRTHLHFAFQAEPEDEMIHFHSAALGGGGADNGKPGLRDYHPGCFAAFVLDPDGNNIDAVWHGPAELTVESIMFTAPQG